VVHYTLNTARSISSPRSAASAEVIEALRPLVRRGGIIPNHSPFRITILHHQNCAVFTVRRGTEAITNSMLAWALCGEGEAWMTIENLFLSSAFILPPLAFSGVALSKPTSLPWVAVVLRAGLANQPREICSWLGEFEWCMAWAILSERQKL
jgi:hypothetical protein